MDEKMKFEGYNNPFVKGKVAQKCEKLNRSMVLEGSNIEGGAGKWLNGRNGIMQACKVGFLIVQTPEGAKRDTERQREARGEE